MRKPRPVASFEESKRQIQRYAKAVRGSRALRARVAQTHSWFAIPDAAGGWHFAPSKFAGYDFSSAADYVANAGKGGKTDGRATERALKTWYVEVDPSSRLGHEVAAALDAFVATLGAKRRSSDRINVPASAAVHGQSPAAESRNWISRIALDPRTCNGRPFIRGTRVRVGDILEMLSEGATREEILSDYDYLSDDDISAALAYAVRAIDHRVIRAA